ncbi:MAG: methylmalonyl-CoA epimerase [Flavobacteriales bacterium]|jgi:methylmalonyl-CoA/ethylmalonyl-CoA epimerase|tara:strand:+ start:1791 stop:2192 length:402 start_codon:yes stop_codon:yes gene_type:complete
MRKIEHIGIAVSNIDASNKVFQKIFGKASYKSEKVESEGVVTSFFQIGENKIELVSATNTDSPISKYLSKNKESMHHIAFDVENIEKEIYRLQKEGIRILNDKPKKGADNKLICFLHPKDTNGVLIELCQEIK